jgi:3-oxoacyl-[acyl-carrier protein] reductase
MSDTRDEQLAGRIAVITGAGRGIGRAIALEYAREGAHLCLVSRTRSQLESVAEEVVALGRRALVVPADVTDPAQVENMAAQIEVDPGQVHILVNNAGGVVERSLTSDSDPDLWVQDVTLNLIGAYRVTHALLPLLVKAGGGHVINIGSGMGHGAGADACSYRVAKAGLWMFTRCLAAEVWEHGINVNELIPGPVETDQTRDRMQVGAPPPFAPSERVKHPEDVAPLALWLATQPPGGPTAQSFSLARRPV